MPIEIEKKYRLSKKQREELLQRLPEIGAVFEREEFEENTLYGGGQLNQGNSVLRLRRISTPADASSVPEPQRALLTYKQRFPSTSAIKHQREDETEVSDSLAMAAILESLGLVPALVYEKRRATWRLRHAEIAVDELPFGLFMEIEGPEAEILELEKKLAIKRLRAEHETYPQLTSVHGKARNGLIEARFAAKD